VGYRRLKWHDPVIIRFYLVPACGGQTDGRTDGAARTGSYLFAVHSYATLPCIKMIICHGVQQREPGRDAAVACRTQLDVAVNRPRCPAAIRPSRSAT